MRNLKTIAIFAFLALGGMSLRQTVGGEGEYFEVYYPPSSAEGELKFGVTYTVWMPPQVKTLRGVIVHQHGCGEGACKGGETAAHDLHWQALARKWDCVLLGPSFQQKDGENCRLWCDPRNGSAKTFLQALSDLGEKSQHPELAQVPWCLWGHSGGGFWASIMQTLYPDRIVAIWFRSGTAFSAWEKGEIAKPEIPETAYSIPCMLNPGIKERDDMRFKGAWTGSIAMFEAYRKKDALIGMAPDPKTSHECGDSRYMAIPFFDHVLRYRLPDSANVAGPLRAMPEKDSLFGDFETGNFSSTPENEAGKLRSWLPNKEYAGIWKEYLTSGTVTDVTPPPAPFGLKIVVEGEKRFLLWSCNADLESGLHGFEIVGKVGKKVELPAKPNSTYGRPLFQGMTYHDTPIHPMSEMRYEISDLSEDELKSLAIRSSNTAGLKSEEVRISNRE